MIKIKMILHNSLNKKYYALNYLNYNLLVRGSEGYNFILFLISKIK